MSSHRSDPVEEIAALATSHDFRIGVAESLTGGQLASRLAAGPDASDWFRGGVVAYAPEVKFNVLGVPPGPVVTETCAREMARGAARVLGGDATVAVTGVGGPEPEEGQPPGTVYVATVVRGAERCARLELSGEPDEIVTSTTRQALELLDEALREHASSDAVRRSEALGNHAGGTEAGPAPARDDGRAGTTSR
jgi:nicotinamide-nucleotide amidase